MITPQSILDKIEWEGWPDAIEWLDPEEVEDETLKAALQRAYDAYLDLVVAHDDIEARIDELLEDAEDD